MTTKRFTLEEADALVPWLELELGKLAKLREKASESAQALGGLEAATRILEGQPVPAGLELEADRFLASTAQLVAAVERVNARGCLVQDLDLGHVDFPGSRAGEAVHLCWHFGEPHVAHFHGPDSPGKRQKLSEAAASRVAIH